MIDDFNTLELKKLYIPPKNSHKGENGKLIVIGGSKLFHAASLWALKIASRIVDMVFYSSVPENNRIVEKVKEEFQDGIVVPRDRLDSYMQEVDVVLIGPGLPREEGKEQGDDDTKELTERLFKKYPNKKWVVDGGSLQVISPDVLPKNAIITPHKQEFTNLFRNELEIKNHGLRIEDVSQMAKKYEVIILLKGERDIVCSPEKCVQIAGGNAGMTKGGTGDVLAGLIAALNCKNDLYLAACAGSYINKKAGEELFRRVGYSFNASDLVDEIPKVMKELYVG